MTPFEYTDIVAPQTYDQFLASKVVIADERGSESAGLTLRPHLFPHQADLARWAIRGGNRAIFASFGLGKTDIQLQIIESILAETVGYALIVCPLGVKGEFVRAARERFGGMTLPYIRSAAELETLKAEGHRQFITNELIHYAGFLGIMDTGQALTRFFKSWHKRFAFRLNEGNVKRHTFERLDSFVDAIVGKRLTYKQLIAAVPA
jgi:hypothetical protein